MHIFISFQKIYTFTWLFSTDFNNIFSVGVSRPVNEWHAIILACANTHQYLFRHAIVTCAKLYMMS